jgi:hypothetical protein
MKRAHSLFEQMAESFRAVSAQARIGRCPRHCSFPIEFKPCPTMASK